MRDIDKQSVRQRKSRAFADFARRVEETFTWFMTTPANILECLSQARLDEKNAVSTECSREKLRLEVPPADPPPEFSDQTIARYYLQAARMYEAAGTYAVLRDDLCRAFKRYRKAAKCGGRCNELLACGDPEVLAAAEDYRKKTALIRYEIARRSVRRKKLTLGLGRRLR
jgi:hypothetical protein